MSFARKYCATAAATHSPRLVKFGDGDWSCHRHLSEQQRQRMAATDDSVHGRLKPHGWPYGADVCITTRERLAEWLLAHDLRRSSSRTDCLHWVQHGQCATSGCTIGRGYRWMDHTSQWINNTHRVLVTHPYHLGEHARTELDDLAASHPSWTVNVACPGWYGHDTFQISLWAPRVPAK